MGSSYSVPALVQWYRLGNASFGRAGYEAACLRWNPDDLDVDLRNQVHIVTGGNAGLGRIVVESLASRHADVHVLCRSAEKGQQAIQEIQQKIPYARLHLHVVDVSDVQAVKQFAQHWQQSVQLPVNSLILNAGVLNKKRQLNADNMEASWATAINQSYLLTGLMLPSLVRAGPNQARIVHVSSGGGLNVKMDLDDPFSERRAYDGTFQYALAKRMQIELADMWADRLEKAGIFVCSMHPGWSETPGVLTSLRSFAEQNKGKLRTPEQGSDTIVWLAAAKLDAIKREAKDQPRLNGLFWFDRSPAQKHFWLARTHSSNQERTRLWELCSKWFGWNYDGSQEQKSVEQVNSDVAASSSSSSSSS